QPLGCSWGCTLPACRSHPRARQVRATAFSRNSFLWRRIMKLDSQAGRAEDLAGLSQAVRAFVDREVRPVIAEFERNQRFPTELMTSMAGLGNFGAKYPEEIGASRLGTVAQCLVIEELARASGGLAATATVQVLSLFPIFLHGSDIIKDRYLQSA